MNTHKIAMLVSLKIPDSTALSAKQALIEMGNSHLHALDRAIYHEFEIEGDAESFKKGMSKADLLLNSNKHSATFSIPSGDGKIAILVEDENSGNSLLLSLKERLGFSQIKEMKSGVLWIFTLDSKHSKEDALRMANDLLCNPHYQTCKVVS